MDTEELKEAIERAETPGGKRVAMTMAIVAVLLAVATMFGHRAHTEEVVLQTRTADEWAYFQAKNNRSQIYAADAKLAGLLGDRGPKLAEEFAAAAEEQKKDAEAVRHEAEKLEEETRAIARAAKYFDFSEVLLEVSIVLGSISLLTGGLGFWKMSLVSTAIGIVLVVVGVLL